MKQFKITKHKTYWTIPGLRIYGFIDFSRHDGKYRQRLKEKHDFYYHPNIREINEDIHLWFSINKRKDVI